MVGYELKHFPQEVYFSNDKYESKKNGERQADRPGFEKDGWVFISGLEMRGNVHQISQPRYDQCCATDNKNIMEPLCGQDDAHEDRRAQNDQAF